MADLTNVLITSIASKKPMIRAFVAATRQVELSVIGCDADPAAPATEIVDSFRPVPPTDSPQFEASILSLCDEKDIGLIIPSRDGDLLPLAAMAGVLQARGIIVPLPDKTIIETCLDKGQFCHFLTSNGFRSIPILDDISTTDLPVFARARHGAGGRGNYQIESLDEALVLLSNDDYLVHPFLEYPEYSIDVLSDFEGHPIQAVARERRQVVNGEANLTTIRSRPLLEKQSLELAALLGLKGHSILQAFLPPDGDPIFIEANLRFGGASIASVNAGLDSPSRMLAMAFGPDRLRSRARQPAGITCGLTLSRTDQGDSFYLSE